MEASVGVSTGVLIRFLVGALVGASNKPLPLGPHKYTCKEGSATAIKMNQYTPMEKLLIIKKNEHHH